MTLTSISMENAHIQALLLAGMEPEYSFGEAGAAIFPSTQDTTTSLTHWIDKTIHAAFTQSALNLRKTTYATALAAKDGPKKTLEELVPAKFLRYRKVFDDVAAQRLPEHQPWDHAIEIKPGSTHKDCSIYQLTLAELDAL